MDIISSIVAKINSFLWDFALLFLLCGTGIYFTIRLKFVQIAKFKDENIIPIIYYYQKRSKN